MMNKIFLFGCLVVWGLTACSGTQSVTHKRWELNRNTVYLKDVTQQETGYEDAGLRMRLALEDHLSQSILIVSEDKKDAKYQLAYKITKYDSGSRLKRLATLGIDDGSRAVLTVKVALIGKKGVLGAWNIKTWVRGGLTGGTEDQLFSEAAAQILSHLKGY